MDEEVAGIVDVELRQPIPVGPRQSRRPRRAPDRAGFDHLDRELSRRRDRAIEVLRIGIAIDPEEGESILTEEDVRERIHDRLPQPDRHDGPSRHQRDRERLPLRPHGLTRGVDETTVEVVDLVIVLRASVEGFPMREHLVPGPAQDHLGRDLGVGESRIRGPEGRVRRNRLHRR